MNNASFPPFDDSIENPSSGGSDQAEEILKLIAIGAREDVARRAFGDLREAFSDQRFLPIHQAACEENVAAVAQILREDPSQANSVCEAPIHQQRTPLHFVAERNNIELARLLLEAGADPNARNSMGQTPLHAGCFADSPEIVNLLLDHGSDPNLAAFDGRKAIRMCRQSDQRLASTGVESPLEILLRRGAEVGVEDAAYMNLTDRLRELLGANPGYDLNQSVDRSDEADLPQEQGTTTLLHCIAGLDLPDVARILLEYGADPTIRDYQEWTPLHHAARENQPRVARVLLEHGADVLIQGEDAGSVLDICSHVGVSSSPNNETVASLIVKHGGRLDLRQAIDFGFTTDVRRMLATDPECVRRFSSGDEKNWVLDGCAHMLEGLTDLGMGDDWCRSKPEKRAQVVNDTIEKHRDIIDAIGRSDVKHATTYPSLHSLMASGGAPIVNLLAKYGAQIVAMEHESTFPYERDAYQQVCEGSPEIAAWFSKMGAQFPIE